MNVEFNIENHQTVLLIPYRIDSSPDSRTYNLLDDEQNVWMELEKDNNTFKILDQDTRIVDSDEEIKSKLDDLLLEVIESEQSGKDINEVVKEEERPFNPEDINVHAKQFSLRLIKDMIDVGDIDLSPDFQRNFVWTNFQKSRLIESILLRIPLPMFYFSEDEEGRITIVDGLQRLTTISDFMNNKFPLKNLEYLDESCNGKYFQSEGNKEGIEPKYFRWFNQTQFSVNVIDPSSPAKVKYDIFRRINTGGKPLNNQEIRNCLAGERLRDTLRKMAESTEFKEATDYSIRSKRMEDHEVALRFILFHRLVEQGKLNTYNGSMDSFLDDVTEELSSKREDLEKYVVLYKNAMLNANYLIGRRHAFRKIQLVDTKPLAYKQIINKALFVSLSVTLSKFTFEEIKSNCDSDILLLPLAREIENDETFFNYLSYGTNGKANLLYSFEKIGKLVEDNIIML